MTMVVEVWNDFCKEHWPELFSQIDDHSSASKGIVQHARRKDRIRTKETAEVELYGT